jgi:hypothetical protein
LKKNWVEVNIKSGKAHGNKRASLKRNTFRCFEERKKEWKIIPRKKVCNKIGLAYLSFHITFMYSEWITGEIEKTNARGSLNSGRSFQFNFLNITFHIFYCLPSLLLCVTSIIRIFHYFYSQAWLLIRH